VAKACNGWILDTDKHQLFTPAALAEHLPSAGGVDVRKTIVVHEVSGGAELTFLDTAGMNRFGFHELYVAFVLRTRVNSVTNLLNATAQTLIERGVKPGAMRALTTGSRHTLCSRDVSSR
jgi:hypothetical protein